MTKRILIILLAVILLFATLGIGAIGGGVLAYFLFQARSAQASAFPEEITRFVQPVPQAQPFEQESGLLVAGVEPGSPADRAGIVRGDIILEVNGEALDQGQLSLQRALRSLNSGESVELQVAHGDEVRTLSVAPEDRDGQPYLGIQSCGAPGMRDFFTPGQPGERLAGALITEVVTGSPAEQAGLQAGDRILSVDDQEVGLDQNLGEIIAGYKPGDQVALEVVNNGETRQVEVTLGENPDEAGRAYLGVSYSPVPMQVLPNQPGEPMPFPNIPWDQMPGMNPQELPEGVSGGVLIGQVEADSPAADAGLQDGDLIIAVEGETVSDPQTVVQAVQAKQPGDKISLEIYRSGEEAPRQVEVTLGERPKEAGKAYMGVALTGAIQINPENGSPMPFQFQLPDGHPDINPFEQTVPNQEGSL